MRRPQAADRFGGPFRFLLCATPKDEILLWVPRFLPLSVDQRVIFQAAAPCTLRPSKPSTRSARSISVSSVLKLWRRGVRREPPIGCGPRSREVSVPLWRSFSDLPQGDQNLLFRGVPRRKQSTHCSHNDCEQDT